MLIATLKNRNFRNFFLADIFATFGSSMSFIGSGWFILQHAGTNEAVGILFTICIAGGLLLFPFSGTIADRFDRRRVMLIVNMLRALTVLVVAVTIASGVFHVALVYLLSAIAGMGWAVQIPTSRGIAQELLAKEEYVSGSSLLEISMQVGAFSAAAMCGFVYHLFGYVAILAINTLTFLVSIFFLAKIVYQTTAVHGHSQGFFEQFFHGTHFLLHHRHIFWFGVVMYIPFVATMSLNVLLPGYVSQHLHSNAVVYGFADMSYGIGACLSGFVAARFAKRWDPFKTIIFFFIFSITALLYLMTNTMIASLYLVIMCVGLGHSSLRILMNAKLMHMVPTTYMGRSQSVWLSISMLLQIVSTYGMGRSMDAVPTPFGFLWLATIMLIGLMGTMWLFPKLSDKLLIHVE